MDAANEHAQMGGAGRADQMFFGNTVHAGPLTVMLGKTEGEEEAMCTWLGDDQSCDK
jgi:hypothetical protein